MKKWLIAAILVLPMLLSACGGAPEADKERVSVETEYVTLRYSGIYEGKLTHSEAVQDGVAVEVFSTTVGGGQREMFRIYFNAETQGTVMGYITRGAEEIAVSYQVSEYEEDSFASAEEMDAYYELMDALQDVLSSVSEDPQFSAERYAPEVAEDTAALKYWEVELPVNVYWEESQTEDSYRVDFYGFVEDVRVDLYSVGWGMEGNVLGTFEAGGESRNIQILVREIPENQNWDEADYDSVYRMMESVNVIVEAITADAE